MANSSCQHGLDAGVYGVISVGILERDLERGGGI